MPLFILAETSAGYALLKAKDKKLLQRDKLPESETVEDVHNLFKLSSFQKFDSATNALNEAAAIADGKVTPMLSSLLDSIKEERKASLAVADIRLGQAIKALPQLSIKPIADSSTAELFRGIRAHIPSLVPALSEGDLKAMSLGLSHSLSRYKLKFSPDKVDTMIISAIALLDDLDKELNIYSMRVREWYGWHFPEMAKLITDNLAYARVVLLVGMRSKCADTDLSEVLTEETELSVKHASEISMGTEISEDDLLNIRSLAEQVVSFTEYRQQLSTYLTTRMQAIAPNLTALVGELIGARLIAHAGSLVSLAKSPASTIQILGAEKALFRALKTKHDTPKYGLIYHASLIGQASSKNKGKVSRMLAAKAALSLRVDALSEWGIMGVGAGAADSVTEITEEEKSYVGNRARSYVERRLAQIEGRPLRASGVGIAPQGQLRTQSGPGKFEVKETRRYNKDTDGLLTPATTQETRSTVSKTVTPAPATNGAEESASESAEDESEDEEMEDVSAKPAATKGELNGKPTSEKDAKEAEKEARKARKAERAAKREAKAAKKAAKEAKKAVKKDGKEGKKRKREAEDAEEGKKEKRKKSSKA